ncbi:hypothetical protein BGZ99_004651 [Dissophora globulifera]|uniref:JmjC domain-containing protein n=1 Tax=Dissophora globulifera TaxID=979702 RepID=A0A9P6UUT2_9FUNG|nr:hypothetical protein BGZ99_004651 [Dissophora globulifera]
MAVLTASTPKQIQGLPQPSDGFPRRFRNRQPLAIRQIVSPEVLARWSSDQEHVAQALTQSVQPLSAADPPTQAPPQLPVMVAEDTKNFIDNPQFTKQINMTAKEIVARVLVRAAFSSDLPHNAGSSSDVKGDEDEASTDMFVQEDDAQTSTPRTILASTSTATTTATASCPLCESHASEQANFDSLLHNSLHQHLVKNHCKDDNNQESLFGRRFYYRGPVPASLYSDLDIPRLLSSLSLPSQSTATASAPNKDLMRIWMSLAGATTPLHYDSCHGILIQLVGRKRFVVFSHDDANSLYAYDGISGPGHASKVRGLGHCFPFANATASAAAAAESSAEATAHTTSSTSPLSLKAASPLISLPASLASSTSSLLSITAPPRSLSSLSRRNQDDSHLQDNMADLLERWPKVKNTDPWVVDLEPGDALYTPPGFWHEVTSVDNSISITVPWDMDVNELQSLPAHMLK